MRKLLRLAVAVLFTFLAAGLATFIFQTILSIRTHDELDYGEGIVLWQAAHVTNWKAAYHPIAIYPHIVFHYPPLYHLASRAMAVATGDLLAAGRLVSSLSLLGTCFILGGLVWRCLPAGCGVMAQTIGAF